MASDYYLITVERARTDTRTFIVLQPRLQPLPQDKLMRANKRPLLPLPQCLGEFLSDFLPCLAVERGAPGLPGLWITSYSHLRHPEPICTPCDRPLIVPAFLRHPVLSPLSSSVAASLLAHRSRFARPLALGLGR